jgi:hypothetical protein
MPKGDCQYRDAHQGVDPGITLSADDMPPTGKSIAKAAPPGAEKSSDTLKHLQLSLSVYHRLKAG